MNTLQAARSSCGLTQAELAIQAGVSRHAVMRLEQLCYPTPLPNVVDTLSDITGLSVPSLVNGYRDDIEFHRRETGELWHLRQLGSKLALQTLKHINGPLGRGHRHPFVLWREALAQYSHQSTAAIHFCIDFSIHPATLNAYESFKTGFPPAVGVALLGAGGSQELVDLLTNELLFNAHTD